MDERPPGALEERPAAPQHHRRGQNKLQPVKLPRREQPIERPGAEHSGHRHDHQRQAETDPDPEAPRHVHELRVLLLRHRHAAGLEGHAAKRAVAGRVADHLGMHRTAPLGPGRRRRRQLRLQRHAAVGAGAGGRLLHLRMHGAGVPAPSGCLTGERRRRPGSGRRRRAQIAIGIARESLHAARAAEAVGRALVLQPMGRVGCHGHAADRVDGRPLRLAARMLMGSMLFHGSFPRSTPPSFRRLPKDRTAVPPRPSASAR